MKKYTFPTHRKGDTFDKVTKIVTNLDLSGATVTMKVRKTSPVGPVIETIISTNAAQMTISGGNTINFVPRVIDYPAGLYYYDIQITFADTTVKTYLYGTWKIVQDVTY